MSEMLEAAFDAAMETIKRARSRGLGIDMSDATPEQAYDSALDVLADAFAAAKHAVRLSANKAKGK